MKIRSIFFQKIFNRQNRQNFKQRFRNSDNTFHKIQNFKFILNRRQVFNFQIKM